MKGEFGTKRLTRLDGMNCWEGREGVDEIFRVYFEGYLFEKIWGLCVDEKEVDRGGKERASPLIGRASCEIGTVDTERPGAVVAG